VNRKIFSIFFCGALLIACAAEGRTRAARGALIGAGAGVGTGLLLDGILALVGVGVSVAISAACDHPPCQSDSNIGLYVGLPLGLGAAGAGLGAFIGATIKDDDFAMVPLIRADKNSVSGGGLLLCKQF